MRYCLILTATLFLSACGTSQSSPGCMDLSGRWEEESARLVIFEQAGCEKLVVKDEKGQVGGFSVSASSAENEGGAKFIKDQTFEAKTGSVVFARDGVWVKSTTELTEVQKLHLTVRMYVEGDRLRFSASYDVEGTPLDSQHQHALDRALSRFSDFSFKRAR